MLAALMMTAVLSALPPQDGQAAGTRTPPDPAAAVRLEDVVVDARRLEDAAREFVDEVANPVGRRGLARWHRGVCVGVANLRPELAQQLIDRVSDVARGIGLTSHEPPCHPSILIMATSDADAFTERFIAMRPALFQPGGSGMNQGPAALERFRSSDQVVRWWSVSQPTDSDTGVSAVRMPGQCNLNCIGAGSAVQYAPNTAVRGTARLSSQYRQDLKRTFVIVDVDRLGGVTLTQLADYIAMVALAQIDPDADTSRFETVLNLFDDPAGVQGLSGWDQAYLEGLYGASWYRISQNSQVHAVSDNIAREYRQDRAAEDRDEGGDGR
ncbi:MULTISPECIES: hypothetical protein [unclassified Brevundimonas]|uniref:hypothetical protein n=1 Tax=unclassified Brevundimonas TaxID=2622653 RepID=UPI0006F6D3B6|nr:MULTISPECIES: hypothetical protein [unclassified Brevundimonas]